VIGLRSPVHDSGPAAGDAAIAGIAADNSKSGQIVRLYLRLRCIVSPSKAIAAANYSAAIQKFYSLGLL
jgi:hypothetical protein